MYWDQTRGLDGTRNVFKGTCSLFEEQPQLVLKVLAAHAGGSPQLISGILSGCFRECSQRVFKVLHIVFSSIYLCRCFRGSRSIFWRWSLRENISDFRCDCD